MTHSATLAAYEETAKFIVDSYLSLRAKDNAMTVNEWLRACHNVSADKFNIVENYENATGVELKSGVVTRINRYYDELFAAAKNEIVRKKLFSLHGVTIANVLVSSLDGDQLVFIGDGGEVLFKVSSGRMYDKEGFHFDLGELIVYPD